MACLLCVLRLISGLKDWELFEGRNTVPFNFYVPSDSVCHVWPLEDAQELFVDWLTFQRG